MKNILLLFLTILIADSVVSQNYEIDQGGTVTSCTGTFYDAAGTGDYASNENYNITFCSDNGGNVSLNFTGFPFQVETSFDFLKIYDGTTAAGTLLYNSQVSGGSTNPGVITSTTGCLYVTFTSDGSVSYTGWQALVQCPSCTNGIQDGSETGVDCGGPNCTPCPNCFDGVQNGDETGIDCGGSCEPCYCSNGIQDGDETDVDCGGSCGPCPTPCTVTLDYVVPDVPGGCCTWVFNMMDSFGDGWNGASANVLVNGVAQGPFTISSGSSSSANIAVCHGDAVSINYTASGSFPSEVSFNLTDEDGVIVYASGSSPTVANGVFNGSATCTNPGLLSCSGGPVELIADGIGSFTYALNNDFDLGSAGNGWTSNITADFSNPCDPSVDGGTYMWMGSSAAHPRIIQTVSMDLHCGGQLCFYLDFATQGNSSPCEGIDEPDEGVFLEYSIDGGATWVTIEYFGPNGVGDNVNSGGTDPQMTSWNEYCYTIPSAAETPSTIFRWAQTGSSGLSNDHWGIDNVSLMALTDCAPYVYDYDHIPGSDDGATDIVNVTTTTTYTVTYTNGTDMCTADVTVVIPDAITVDAGLDASFCSGTGGVAIGGAPTATGGSSGVFTYTWTPTIGLNDATSANPTANPATTTTYTVTVTDGNNCTAVDSVVVTVGPPPTVDAVSPQTICAGESTLDIIFTGSDPGATYDWTNDNPTIGLAANGTGDILSFTSLNAGTSSQNATISVTPSVGACIGSPITFTITVNPIPTIDVVLSQTICAGASTTDVLFTGSGDPMTTYDWINDNSTIGLASNGSGNILSFVGQNVSGVSQVANIDVTPSIGTCVGNPLLFTITVDPLPTVNPITSQTICFGTSTTDIVFSGSADPGATYDWVNDNTSIGLAANGTGNILSFVGQNTGFTPLTATIVVTPSVGSCIGSSENFTITVNPDFAPIISGNLEYCTGTSTALNTTLPFTNYNWSTGSTASGINATIADNPITVTVTDANGCIGVSAPVNVNETAALNYYDSITVCDGQSATIHGIPQTVAGVYSQTFPIAGGCDSVSNITLIVNALPAVFAGTDISICEGNTVTLVGSGAVTYAWDNMVTDNVPFTQAVGTVTYTLTGTDNNGCQNTDQVDVTINANPIPLITPDPAEVCAGLVLQMNGGAAGGSGTYTTHTWTGAGSTSLNSTSVQNPDFSNTIAGSYGLTYTVTDDLGCIGSDNITVTVNGNPTPSILPDPANVCAGANLALNGNPSGGSGVYTSHLWSNTGSSSLSTTSTVSAIFTNSAAGTYDLTYTVTDNEGCIGSDNITVNVNANPTTSILPDPASVCAGGTLSLNGNPMGGSGTFMNHVWSNSGASSLSSTNVQSPDFSNSIPGAYNLTYTVTDNNGCAGTDDITVNVTPIATATISGSATVCAGDASPVVTFTGSNGVAPYTFSYTLNGGTTQTIVSTGNTATITVPTVSALINVYVLTGVQDASGNGCSQAQSGTATVVVNNLPNVFAGNDFVTCENEQAMLSGSGATNYAWTGGVSDGVPFYLVATTTFTVTGTDANGCVNTDDITITYEPLPVISFTADDFESCAPFEVNFSNLNPSGMGSCVWSFGDGTVIDDCSPVVTHVYSDGGLYDVTLTSTSMNNCTNSLTYNSYIRVEDVPDAAFATSTSVLSSFNTTVEFANNSVGATDYVWIFGDGSPISTDASPVHTYDGTESTGFIITLIASTPLGCVDTTTAGIHLVEDLIFYMPNTFTPDDDEFNQSLQPVFTSGFDPYSFKMTIFNRWGEVVFVSEDAQVGWDGTYGTNGSYVQDGMYIWKLEFKRLENDEHMEVMGHVTIIR